MELALKSLFFRNNITSERTSDTVSVAPCYIDQSEEYRKVNETLPHGGTIIFGGGLTYGLPFDDYCGKAVVDNVHNRSYRNIKAADAVDLIKNSVLSLYPDRIILNIGEADIDENASAEVTAAAFSKLLAYLRKEAKGTRITVMSVHSENNTEECEKYNKLICSITESYGFEFADISSAFASSSAETRIFSMIGRYLRNGISFSQAMYLGAV